MPKPKPQATMLRIDQIETVRELQAREEMCVEHVTDIRQAVDAKIKLPRVVVYQVTDRDNTYYCVDGMHTIAGFQLAGKKTIPAMLHVGTWVEARMAAAGANTGHHALKRTHADKRRAIRMALETSPYWSDGAIARHVGVSDKTVADVRPTVQPRISGVGAPSERVGADGKTRHVAPKADKPDASPSVDEGDEKALETEGTDSKKPGNNGARSVDETPSPRKIKVFDWKTFEQHFGSVVRSTDSLASSTGHTKPMVDKGSFVAELQEIVNEHGAAAIQSIFDVVYTWFEQCKAKLDSSKPQPEGVK